MNCAAVWIIVIAAGYSRRMGTHKLLLPVGEHTMLHHVVQKALQTKAVGVAVVVNPAFPELTNTIHDLPVVILQNYEAKLGMSSSLRLAVHYLTEVSADGVCVLLADQPGIDPLVIDRVIVHYKETGAAIVQADYQGRPGHPVLFGNTVLHELGQISGDQGGRDVIKKYSQARQAVSVDTAEPDDIDIFEDYQRVIGDGGSRR
jgi:molybdenum cofactor cytidylyltransferase